MPLLDRQRKGRQIGEIRLGMTVKTQNGSRPEKLNTFRLTTQSGHVAQEVARQLGGRVVETKLLNGKATYEVVTNVSELPVIVPPGDAVISQWYEMWTAAGCSRRCDGFNNTIDNTPCKCPEDLGERRELAKSGDACKPITRVNVMLPDVPDLGVWLVSSTGENAADELGGAAEVLRAAREKGTIIPAVLRMEHREKRVVGQKPRRFVVPVLEIGASLRQMVALEAGQDIASALPPPPPNLQAIGSGSSPDDEPIEAELVEDHEAKPLGGAAVESSGLTTLDDRLGSLSEAGQQQVWQKIQEANFPIPIPKAAEKQVLRWIEEVEQGEPF